MPLFDDAVAAGRKVIDDAVAGYQIQQAEDASALDKAHQETVEAQQETAAVQKRFDDHMLEKAPAGHPVTDPPPPPPPPPPPVEVATLIGSSVNGPLLKTLGYTGLDTARTYFRSLPAGSKWNGGIPNDTSAYSDLHDALTALRPGGLLSLSYKETDVAKAAAFFATMPKDLPYDVTCTFNHEPENDSGMTTTQAKANYRAVWRDHAAMMRSFGMVPTLILMRFTLTKASGRNWRDYYPGDGVCDVLGWDCYRKNDAGDNGPAAAASMAAPMEQIAKDTGTLAGIFETGSTSVRYSEADTAAWAKSWRDHLLADQADVWLCAQWWDKDTFIFTAPTAKAWLGRGPSTAAVSKLAA